MELASWTKAELPPVEKMKDALLKYPISVPDPYKEDKGRELSNLFTEVYELEKGDTIFRMLFLDGRHIFQDYLDKRLKDLGWESDLLVFLSKHKSLSETKALTAHVSGNPVDADFGGLSCALPTPAPLEMKKLLLVMDRLNIETDLGYDVTFEVTHHGPSEIETPSLFVEIGSTEKEWVDPKPGKIIAKAVLSLAEHSDADVSALDERESQEAKLLENNTIAVAFGGGHYGDRPTVSLFRTKLAFGHMFPKYQLETVTEDVILKAFEKTGSNLAFFDKKSMRGPDRRRITEILEQNNISILNDKESVAKYGVGFNLREKEDDGEAEE